MCLAIPGKIVKIEKDKAIIDYGKEKRTAKLIEEGYSVGDYVLVQSALIIKKIPEKEAVESIKEWDKLNS